MKIAVIDNFDSFTFNLVHYLQSFDAEVIVFRNNQLDFKAINNCDAILISPGPGKPSEAFASFEILKKYAFHKPVLGICLGFQAIVLHFHGALQNMKTVLHGKSSKMSILSIGKLTIFKDLPSETSIGHYHSWACKAEDLTPNFKILASNEEGWVMAFCYKNDWVCGLQFHPESVLTPHGKKMIANWLEMVGKMLLDLKSK